MNNLYHSILVLRRHLIVAGQAEPSSEDICADVDAGSSNIGVALSPAVTFHRDKSIGTIDRLHVHGLPDGTALGIEGSEGGQDFTWAALPRFMLPELILLAADEGAHGALVDDQTAEPEVWFRVLHIIRVHLHWEILQAFFVTLVDRLFLGDVFIQIRYLSTDDTGNDIRHAVVEADLLMLIPGGRFAALGRPLANLVGIFQTVGQEHAAGGAGDDLPSWSDGVTTICSG